MMIGSAEWVPNQFNPHAGKWEIQRGDDWRIRQGGCPVAIIDGSGPKPVAVLGCWMKLETKLEPLYVAAPLLAIHDEGADLTTWLSRVILPPVRSVMVIPDPSLGKDEPDPTVEFIRVQYPNLPALSVIPYTKGAGVVLGIDAARSQSTLFTNIFEAAPRFEHELIQLRNNPNMAAPLCRCLHALVTQLQYLGYESTRAQACPL